MEKFELILHKSLGPVALGTTRDELRKSLNEPFEELEEGPDEELDGYVRPPADYFEDSGIKVEYDKDKKVMFIEAGNLIPVNYKGHSLLDISFRELYQLFSEEDPEIELDEDGFVSDKLGLSCFAPGHADDDEDPAELISIFAPHYFEEE